MWLAFLAGQSPPNIHGELDDFALFTPLVAAYDASCCHQVHASHQKHGMMHKDYLFISVASKSVILQNIESHFRTQPGPPDYLGCSP